MNYRCVYKGNRSLTLVHYDGIGNIRAQMKKAVPYYRVSTKHQEESGLGLEAQVKTVEDFAVKNGFILMESYVEIESGRKNDRPVLKNALKACTKENGILIIARLNRLSRSVAFLSALMETKIEFIAVDMPYANKFVLHIMIAVAQFQAEEAAQNTRDALRAAKLRGIELGKNGKYVLSKRNKDAANLFALKMQPIIEKLNEHGVITVRKISRELNKRRIATYGGNKRKWHPTTVQNLVVRLKCLHKTQS